MYLNVCVRVSKVCARLQILSSCVCVRVPIKCCAWIQIIFRVFVLVSCVCSDCASFFVYLCVMLVFARACSVEIVLVFAWVCVCVCQLDVPMRSNCVSFCGYVFACSYFPFPWKSCLCVWERMRVRVCVFARTLRIIYMCIREQDTHIYTHTKRSLEINSPTCRVTCSVIPQ